MGKAWSLAATRVTAAKLLEMKPAEFDALVASGALPPPVRLGPHERWSVAELEAIVAGTKFKPSSEFDL